MVSKAVALPKTDRTEFIKQAFYRAAAHLAAKVTITSSLQPDLKWHCIVAGERHKIDRAAQGQRTVFERIPTPKNFGATERGNVKVFQNGFAVGLVVIQAVQQ